MKGKIEIKKQEVDNPCHTVIMTVDVEWKSEHGFTNTDLDEVRLLMYDLLTNQELQNEITVDGYKYTYVSSVDRDTVMKRIGELWIKMRILESNDTLSKEELEEQLREVQLEMWSLSKLV